MFLFSSRLWDFLNLQILITASRDKHKRLTIRFNRSVRQEGKTPAESFYNIQIISKIKPTISSAWDCQAFKMTYMHLPKQALTHLLINFEVKKKKKTRASCMKEPDDISCVWCGKSRGEIFRSVNEKVTTPWPNQIITLICRSLLSQSFWANPRTCVTYSNTAHCSLQEVTAFFCPRQTISSSFTRKRKYYWRNRK